MADYKALETENVKLKAENEGLMTDKEGLVKNRDDLAKDNEVLRREIREVKLELDKERNKKEKEKKWLAELKEKAENFKMDWSKYSSKDQRRFKEHFIQDKKTLIDKIEKIENNRERETNYLEDITELLGRLKKIGVKLIDEEKEEPKRESPVL